MAKCKNCGEEIVWASLIVGERPVNLLVLPPEGDTTPTDVSLWATVYRDDLDAYWLAYPDTPRSRGGPPPSAHLIPPDRLDDATGWGLTLAVEHKFVCKDDPGEAEAILGKPRGGEGVKA